MNADKYEIVPFEESDLQPVLSIWQEAFSDRVYDFQMNEVGFRQKVLNHPSFDPNGASVARVEARAVGFALAVTPEDGEAGFLSVLAVHPAYRQKGIGAALLNRAEEFLKTLGRAEIRVGYRGNPISFAAGADVRTPGYYFLLNRGFRNRGSLSLFMEIDLNGYEWPREVSGFVEDNKTGGVRFGLCDEDHREALCRLMEERFSGGWGASIARALEGEPPYPVFVATDGPKVIGFSGPVRAQPGGRGGFTGIGTHPDYRRRKIGTVLFHLMCAEFKRRGAKYSTLHTGLHNPAQEIYLGAGFKVRHLTDYDLVKRLD